MKQVILKILIVIALLAIAVTTLSVRKPPAEPEPTPTPALEVTPTPAPEPTPSPTPEPTPEPAPANFDGLAEQPTTVFAEGEQPSYTTTADASMNLRAGPGTNFDKVTSVPAGTAVTALGTNSDGSWVVVQVGGQYGWLKVEFLNQ